VAAVRRLALLLAGAAVACGDPLADDRYRGDPLMHLQGDAAPRAEEDDFINLRLALFWMARGPYDGDVARMVEDPGAVQELPRPGPFVINVFDPPPAAALAPAGYGIARLLVYRDRDHSGRREAGEPFLGAVGPEALLYAPHALDQAGSPTRRGLPGGFHQVMLPLLCDEPAPPPADATDCGVPLGAACDGDADCGRGGICVKRLPAPVVNGACMLPAGGCRPAGGAYFPTRWLGNFPGVYLKACRVDADCLRPSDMGKALYRCDVGAGGCVPRLGLHVDVRPDYPLAPVCGDAPPGPQPAP
jgi:hypothetical protein